jgi:hypothetical protein
MNKRFLFISVMQIALFQLAFSQKQVFDFAMADSTIKSRPKSKVMILGSFHFNDGGQDAYKPRFSVDIKSPRRQDEVLNLVQLLATFKPTKVAIESMASRQPFHDSLYTEFVNHRYQPGFNEIFQIGYRLAALMKHQQVFTIDVMGREYEGYHRTDSFAIANKQTQYLDSFYSQQLFKLYATEDSLKSVWPLRKMLAYHNNPERLRIGLGHYLTGDFEVAANGMYPGADQATSWWNRNLRIFANILQLTTSSTEERVFVLIGAGHLQILRFLAIVCPDIEFVDVYDLLK